MAKKKVCLVQGCGGPLRSRGLCNSCYTAAKRLVALERTTWEQLVEQGCALPAFGELGRSKLGKMLASKLSGSAK